MVDQEEPSFKHYYIKLDDPVNHFRLEGAFVLPPKKLSQKRGKAPMVIFAIGYDSGDDMPLYARITAFDELARTVEREFQQGDHVIVTGGFKSWYAARLRHVQMSLVATSIERVPDKGKSPNKRVAAQVLDGVLDAIPD